MPAPLISGKEIFTMPSHAPIVTTSRFTAARGCVSDVANLAQEIPLFPVERTMPLGPLAAVRAAVGKTATAGAVRIGWAAVFLKAYALVAREMPVLRTWLVRGFAGTRLATAAESVATLAVNRVEDGEDRLFWARLAAPDAKSLPEIQQFVVDCATKPVEEMFKRQLQLEMVPGFLRRTILRWNMNSFSRKRAARIGTFSLSTLAGMGATNRFHPTICTTSLSYAPLDADGNCLVTIIADHRVLDGAVVARALARLEEVLCHEMLAELRGLADVSPPVGGKACA
jgi:pyruvate/2-oxoglutarate dehydrogenase complex dihydrolipoamide acyltransferase (E2) component